MEKDLQSIIMAEIGLDKNYEWYKGSSSCEYRRMKAVNMLSDVIQKYHDAGESIDSPNKDLIRTLQVIALKGEEDRCDLTNTWKAISYVISEHIYQANQPDEKKAEAYEVYRVLNDYLREEFPLD